MSRSTKIILGALAAALAVAFLFAGVIFSFGSLAWGGIGGAVDFNDDDVTAKAAEIASFQLPAGYGADYLINAAGFTVVAFDPGDKQSHLMLVQVPAWLELDSTQFEKQLRRDFGNKIQWGDNGSASIVDHRTLRVAGKPVEFAISEGANSAGSTFRSMAGLWDRPDGQVFIYIEEPLTRWNQAKIDAFVATIES